MAAAYEAFKKRSMGGILLKTTIVITLYILAAVVYAWWCFGEDKTIGIKLLGFEEEWKTVVGAPTIVFRLIMMTTIMVVCMSWPILLAKRIKYDLFH